MYPWSETAMYQNCLYKTPCDHNINNKNIIDMH